MIKDTILLLKNMLLEKWPFILAGILWGGQALSFSRSSQEALSPFDLILGAIFFAGASCYQLYLTQRNSLPIFKDKIKNYFLIFIFWIGIFIFLSAFSYYFFLVGSLGKIIFRIFDLSDNISSYLFNLPSFSIGYLWLAFFFLGAMQNILWHKVYGVPKNPWKNAFYMALGALLAPLAGHGGAYFFGFAPIGYLLTFAILGALIAPSFKNETIEDEV